ncbi:MAG: glycosyltransferase family 9 protein [bacterium]|jgi:ADP-heptose:LPS heptosyltransferase
MSVMLHHLKRMPHYANIIASALRFRFHLRQYRGNPLILVDRFGGMGDVISCFPLLGAIRAKYPKAYIVFRTTSALIELPSLSGYVDEVVEDERCDEVPRSIRVRDIDLNSFDFHFAPQHTTDPGVTQKDRLSHIVDAFCNQYDLVPASRQPHIALPETYRVRLSNEIHAVRTGSGPIIFIHCGPSWPVKEWAPSAWAELTRRFHSELDATVIQVGADWHYDARYDAVPRIPGAIHWIGSLTVTETAAAVAGADLLVGIDSGLLHIAGAVGTPSIGLFGPTSPHFHLPLETESVAVHSNVSCLGCHHLPKPLHWKTSCPQEIACMRELQVEWALDASRSMLQKHQKMREEF